MMSIVKSLPGSERYILNHANIEPLYFTEHRPINVQIAHLPVGSKEKKQQKKQRASQNFMHQCCINGFASTPRSLNVQQTSLSFNLQKATIAGMAQRQVSNKSALHLDSTCSFPACINRSISLTYITTSFSMHEKSSRKTRKWAGSHPQKAFPGDHHRVSPQWMQWAFKLQFFRHPLSLPLLQAQRIEQK
jgi:hypothetical protein